jgi:hypothetical protein
VSRALVDQSCRLYHVQVVLVLERPLAILAVELMSGLIVMVVYATLTVELLRTRIADEIRIPVVRVIHVLGNSAECWKALVARMAFIIIIHPESGASGLSLAFEV